ncbi:MAG: glycosyltransferase family 4 protein [Candidatus Helarchaeota archaeon]
MKLTITFFTTTGVYPTAIGGPAVFLYHLNSKLKAMNIDSKIFDFSRLRQSQSIFFNSIKRLIFSNILIFNSPPTNLPLILLFLCRLLKKKVFFICHGGLFFELRTFFNQINRALLLLGLKLNLLNQIIVPSKWLAQYLKKFYNIKRIHIIPNGVDVEEITSHHTARLSTRNNLLFVGRLSRIKGILTLFNAFKLVRQAISSNLYIIGPKGNLSDKVLNKIKSFPSIHLKGQVSHSEKISLMKAMDIILLPSLWENFPITLLEAMACAKPIITTSVGGIPEIINQNNVTGILIPPSNSKILAEAITNLLLDEDKRDVLSKNAYDTVKNSFAWKKIALDYLKFLKDGAF